MTAIPGRVRETKIKHISIYQAYRAYLFEIFNDSDMTFSTIEEILEEFEWILLSDGIIRSLNVGQL